MGERIHKGKKIKEKRRDAQMIRNARSSASHIQQQDSNVAGHQSHIQEDSNAAAGHHTYSSKIQTHQQRITHHTGTRLKRSRRAASHTYTARFTIDQATVTTLYSSEMAKKIHKYCIITHASTFIPPPHHPQPVLLLLYIQWPPGRGGAEGTRRKKKYNK